MQRYVTTNPSLTDVVDRCKRRRIYDKQGIDARPRLNRSTTSQKLADNFSHALPIPIRDTQPSPVESSINDDMMPTLVDNIVPESPAVRTPSREKAESDKQGPQHKKETKPCDPTPSSKPALYQITRQLQGFSTPPNNPTPIIEAAERGGSLSGDLEEAQAKVMELEAKVKLREEAQKPKAVEVKTLSKRLKLALERNIALRRDMSAKDRILRTRKREAKQATDRAYKLRFELDNEHTLLKQSQALAISLQGRVESLERKHQSAKKAFGNAEASLTTYQAEAFQPLYELVDTQQHTIQGLRAETGVLQQEQASRQKTLSDLKAKKTARQRQPESKKIAQRLLKLCHEFRLVRQSLQEKTRSLEQSKQSAEGLRTDFCGLEESLHKAQAELDARKQEQEEKKAEKNSQMKVLRREITALRCAGFNSNTNQSLTAVNSTKQDAERLSKEITNLQSQVQEATSRAEKSEDAMQKLANYYDALVLQHRTLSLKHETSPQGGQIAGEHEQLANKVIIRWQRFFADLVYVLFKLIDEDFNPSRLRQIMRGEGVDRGVVREIKARAAQWEPFVTIALQDQCMNDTRAYLTKMKQQLPESSAEVLERSAEPGERQREG